MNHVIFLFFLFWVVIFDSVNLSLEPLFLKNYNLFTELPLLLFVSSYLISKLDMYFFFSVDLYLKMMGGKKKRAHIIKSTKENHHCIINFAWKQKLALQICNLEYLIRVMIFSRAMMIPSSKASSLIWHSLSKKYLIRCHRWQWKLLTFVANFDDGNSKNKYYK